MYIQRLSQNMRKLISTDQFLQLYLTGIYMYVFPTVHTVVCACASLHALHTWVSFINISRLVYGRWAILYPLYLLAYRHSCLGLGLDCFWYNSKQQREPPKIYTRVRIRVKFLQQKCSFHVLLSLRTCDNLKKNLQVLELLQHYYEPKYILFLNTQIVRTHCLSNISIRPYSQMKV